MTCDLLIKGNDMLLGQPAGCKGFVVYLHHQVLLQLLHGI